MTSYEIIEFPIYCASIDALDLSGLVPKERKSGDWEFTGKIELEVFQEDHVADNLMFEGTFHQDRFLKDYGFRLIPKKQ